MAVYQLAGINFISMEVEGGGPPPYPDQKLQPLIRPGVNGTAFLLDAVRGETFQMTTFADFLNDALAAAQLDTYKALIGSGRYNLTWKNNPYQTTHNTQFVVHNVIAIDQQTYGMSAGGSSGNGQRVGLRCRWTLTPVTIPSP